MVYFFQVSGPKHGLLHVHGLLNVKSISQRPSNTYDEMKENIHRDIPC